MKKNIIIAALALGNLALLIVVGVLSRKLQVQAQSSERLNAKIDGQFAAAPPRANQGDSQEFTFTAGEHLNGDVAPQIAGRGLTIDATIDTQQKDGVIIAQGGLAHGYALYVQDGDLFFTARRNNVMTTVPSGRLSEGRHSVIATWTKEGDVSVAVDGGPPATAKAAGPITVTPADGLDVGADRGAAVGPYTPPHKFGGMIETVHLKTSKL